MAAGCRKTKNRPDLNIRILRYKGRKVVDFVNFSRKFRKNRFTVGVFPGQFGAGLTNSGFIFELF
jgi:hypothetical protein